MMATQPQQSQQHTGNTAQTNHVTSNNQVRYSSNIFAIMNNAHPDANPINEITKRNYSYTANVPSLIKPEQAATPETPPYYSFTRLPRVLPPPVYTPYMTNAPTQPATTSSSPVAPASVSSVENPTFFDDHRRHSVTLGNLTTAKPVPANNVINMNGSHLHGSETMPLIESSPTNRQVTVKIEKPNHDVLLKEPVTGSTGERYNIYGQLIGKSGKVLRDTKRAAQNRHAQKAFRLRREKYISNLEKKSKEYDSIVEENKKLKSMIKDLESKLSN